MSDYEAGYRAYVNGELRKEMADHWSGAKLLDRSNDFFLGYQDAEEDVKMSRMGCEQMQFGLSA